MNHKLLLVLLAVVMAISAAGCKKSTEESKAESNLSVTTSGQAAETEKASETGQQSSQAGQADQKEGQTEAGDQDETEANAEGSERILEEDGELIIEVPDGEDTFGE